MLNNDIYNLDNEFDYPTLKDIVLKSLEKIVKEKELREEPLKNTDSIINGAISRYEDNDDPNNVNLLAPPAPHLLKLKIRITTQYLNWRIAVLKRDSFDVRYVILV